jgi:hypothetical protein
MPREAEHRSSTLAAWRQRAAKAADGFGPFDELWVSACWEASTREHAAGTPAKVQRPTSPAPTAPTRRRSRRFTFAPTLR